MFIILYSDDILLLAPSVSELDNLFIICERELKLLDMAINVRKSSCIRIGHRMDAQCANTSLSTGSAIPWVDELIFRYLYTAVSYIYVFTSKSQKIILSIGQCDLWENWSHGVGRSRFAIN